MADESNKYITLENLKYFLEKFKEAMANNGPKEEDTSEQS